MGKDQRRAEYWTHFRIVSFLTCCLLVGLGLFFMIGLSSSQLAGVIGGLLAGAGTGAMVQEVMQVGERRAAAQMQVSLLSQLAESQKHLGTLLEADSNYLRLISEFAMYALPLLSSGNRPDEEHEERFLELARALGIDDVAALPKQRSEESTEGLAIYDEIYQAVVDRRGRRAAAWLDFAYTLHALYRVHREQWSDESWKELSEGFSSRLRTALAEMAVDDWLNDYVAMLLEAFSRGEIQDDTCHEWVMDLVLYLAYFGYRHPTFLEIHDRMRGRLT